MPDERGVPDVSSPAALILRAARLRAARRVLVARQVELTAAAGEVVAVEGVNGAGKSTLLAAAAGLLPAGPGCRRPPTVGYAAERADVLTRLAVRRWLIGLARTAGLSRADAAGQAAELLARLGLAQAGERPLRTLSRGNAQRAMVAQALVGPPGLIVLDEPAGGLDSDGVARLAAQIRSVAGRSSVVLVARHPTAPLPLPAGPTWRIGDGVVRTADRAADTAPAVQVETGDGAVRQVSEFDLPSVLRAALDAGVAVRRVLPLAADPGGEAVTVTEPEPAARPASTPRRAGSLRRIACGAAHRARLLTVSEWFAAPALLYLAVLGMIYAGSAGPPLGSGAFTAAVLVPVLAWVTVLAHLVDGRLVARAFAAHVGGRGRAHLAACLATAPFAIAATLAALIWLVVSQPGLPGRSGLLLNVLTLDHPRLSGVLPQMVALHLAAAVFGVGFGTLLVPPLVDRAGWRICLAVALLVPLLIMRISPMFPLLRLTTHPASGGPAVFAAAGLLAGTALVLIGVTTFLASRLR